MAREGRGQADSRRLAVQQQPLAGSPAALDSRVCVAFPELTCVLSFSLLPF